MTSFKQRVNGLPLVGPLVERVLAPLLLLAIMVGVIVLFTAAPRLPATAQAQPSPQMAGLASPAHPR